MKITEETLQDPLLSRTEWKIRDGVIVLELKDLRSDKTQIDNREGSNLQHNNVKIDDIHCGIVGDIHCGIVSMQRRLKLEAW